MGWYKAYRFCCPTIEDDATSYILLAQPSYNSRVAVGDEEPACPEWRTWAAVLGPAMNKPGTWIGLEAELVEYIAYACVAVRRDQSGRITNADLHRHSCC